MKSMPVKAALLSAFVLVLVLSIWHLYVLSDGSAAPDMDPEYAALMGQSAKGESALRCFEC